VAEDQHRGSRAAAAIAHVGVNENLFDAGNFADALVEPGVGVNAAGHDDARELGFVQPVIDGTDDFRPVRNEF
jgi:hypothetical protein